MPHLTIEYSGNLDDKVSMDEFCGALLEAVQSTGLFELGAIRVRAVACQAYAVADRHVDNAFVDMSFRIGEGRSPEDRKRAGEVIFAVAESQLSAMFETPHFALSLEIREIDKDLSWKKNAMHPRIRGN